MSRVNILMWLLVMHFLCKKKPNQGEKQQVYQQNHWFRSEQTKNRFENLLNHTWTLNFRTKTKSKKNAAKHLNRQLGQNKKNLSTATVIQHPSLSGLRPQWSLSSKTHLWCSLLLRNESPTPSHLLSQGHSMWFYYGVLFTWVSRHTAQGL